jgi:hypothetical protein
MMKNGICNFCDGHFKNKLNTKKWRQNSKIIFNEKIGKRQFKMATAKGVKESFFACNLMISGIFMVF